MVRMEELGKLEKKNHLTGTRTRDLPACSTVPQATTLPCTRNIYIIKQLQCNFTGRFLGIFARILIQFQYHIYIYFLHSSAQLRGLQESL
jgi:hypothetical protein